MRTMMSRAIVLLCIAASSACQSKSDAEAHQLEGAGPRAPQAYLDKMRLNLKFVAGGSFQMGDFGPVHSPERLPYSRAEDDKPLHKVTLDSFSMSAYKITYEDYDVYAETAGVPKTGQFARERGKRHPRIAASVNWRQARDYCQWLGKQLDLPMDLPTEAQWEYAARNRGQFWVVATDNGKMELGRNSRTFDEQIEYAERHGLTELDPSLPLGGFPPNPLGLHDMMTDGQEWVLDWYAANYYAKSPEKNPQGPATGTRKVLRSTRSANGEHLIMGDGLSIIRDSMLPDPAQEQMLSKASDPSEGYTSRCVVNQAKPVGPWSGGGSSQ